VNPGIHDNASQVHPAAALPRVLPRAAALPGQPREPVERTLACGSDRVPFLRHSFRTERQHGPRPAFLPRTYVHILHTVPGHRAVVRA